MTLPPGATLEERVAAIEQALHVPALDFPGQWTDEQVAEFRERFAAEVTKGGAPLRVLPPDPLAIRLPEDMRDPGRVRISEVGPQWREVLPGLECRLIPEHAAEPVLELRRSLLGMPTHAVVEIEWAEGSIKQKFGPWRIAADESHMAVISGFVNGWASGTDIEPERVTLTVGDESIVEGATSPYRADGTSR